MTRNIRASGKQFRKGQYFSFDAIIASIIFILTFVSLVSYWFSVKSSLDSKEDEISKEAARISDTLFTPGYLLNSYADKRVASDRLYNLPSGETELTEMVNTPYRVYLTAVSDSGAQIVSRGTPPTASSRNVAKVRRVFITYNVNDGKETQAALDIYLYDP